MPINPLLISAYTTVNALGRGVAASLRALREGTSALRPCDFEDVELDTWIGRIEGLEDETITGELAMFDCRNNRLAQIALNQDGFALQVAAVRARYGSERIGVFLGTSTSGIREAEIAYRDRNVGSGKLPWGFRHRYTSNVYSIADFVRHRLQLQGPALVISTACSSSAKAFASAYRHLQLGSCDAAVVGGVDSLCLTTLYGFGSLELTSASPCRPWDIDRNGLSLGEAAGFALLERSTTADRGLTLLGYGESSDAYHMSAPHPNGVGAALAMRQALHSAGLQPEQIDYINLHGTGTYTNDAAEDKAVTSLFGAMTPCSSTKGWTGHTLGASGIVEAVFAFLCIEHGLLPSSLNTRRPDPKLSAQVLLETRQQPVKTVLSNSFGFGGTNCSLIFGKIQDDHAVP